MNALLEIHYKMLEALKQSKSGTLIDIEVVPNSKKESMEYDSWTQRIKVKIKEPAVKGKANAGVVKKFTKLFGRCEIKIVSGNLSRKKTLLVSGGEVENISGILFNEIQRPEFSKQKPV